MSSVFMLFGWPVAIALPLFLLAFAGFRLGRMASNRWRVQETQGRDVSIKKRWHFLSFVSRWTTTVSIFVMSCIVAAPYFWLVKRLPGEPLVDVHKLYMTWCAFWLLAAIWNVVEGLLVEMSIALRGRCPVPPLVRAVCRALFYFGVFCLLMRVVMGYNVNVLLTSTAILTGVIGLAMQGVMGNLLSGLSVNSSGLFAVGDYIAAGTNEGVVQSVNWRDTRMKTGQGHLLIIPNSEMASVTVVNYSRGQAGRGGRIDIDVSASYNAAPETVVEALVEAAKAQEFTQEKPAPEAFPTRFGDFSIDYRLRFWVADYLQHLVYRGKVQAAIWHAFQARGIEIPFPIPCLGEKK